MNNNFAKSSHEIKDILNLKTSPVAVYLLKNDEDKKNFSEWEHSSGSRYCQTLMKARHGQSLVMDGGDFACPASCRAFGFKNLPAPLQSGAGLIGFGIVNNQDTGRIMFEGMTYLNMNQIDLIAICPLEHAPKMPDVIVIEGQVEQLVLIQQSSLMSKIK